MAWRGAARHAIEGIAWTWYVHSCVPPPRKCIRLHDLAESHGGSSLYCIRNRESFGAGEEGKENRWPATRYMRSVIVQIRPCGFARVPVQQSASMAVGIPAYLHALPGIRLPNEKRETCPRKDRTCGTITHLEEYVEGGIRSFERITRWLTRGCTSGPFSGSNLQ